MRFVITLLVAALLVGCSTTYYEVRDPSSGQTYYTTRIEEEKGGAVSLKDHRTNAEVTIQNSEVMEMTPEQFDAAIRMVVEAPEPPAMAAPPTEAPAQGEASP